MELGKEVKFRLRILFWLLAIGTSVVAFCFVGLANAVIEINNQKPATHAQQAMLHL